MNIRNRGVALDDRGLSITLWIAAAPSLRSNVSRLDALLDDVLLLSEPRQIDLIYSSEPRAYRITPNGRALLTEALQAECVDRLTYTYAFLDLGQRETPEKPFTLSATLRASDQTQIPSVINEVAAFVRKWCVVLHAASAFISDHNDEGGLLPTTYEARHRLLQPLYWDEVRRFVRGAFWGTYLGPELCKILGGPEQILQDAPVYRAEALGSGVWLQISDSLQADPKDIEWLEAYLVPLLGQVQDRETLRRRQLSIRSRGDNGTIDRQPFISEPSVNHIESLIPLRTLQASLDPDIALNIHLDRTPTIEERAILESTLNEWYAMTYRTEYGEDRLANMSRPSVNGQTVRFSITVHAPIFVMALTKLRAHLAALSSIPVKEIVLGLEEVG